MGVERCRGEPFHGGFDASSGFEWVDGTEHFLRGTQPATVLLSLSIGPARNTYSAGTVTVGVHNEYDSTDIAHVFFMGDTAFWVSTPTGEPNRAAVTALVRVLQSTP